MKYCIAITAVIAAAGILAAANPALADPPWQRGDAEEHEHGHGHDRHEHVMIGREDRDYIRNYISHDYHEHCPPGLAKKHNGCLPPGHARYIIGRPLGEDVVYEEVPDSLLVRLQPVPVGYRYVRVDKDVLLVSEASKEVIDAVTLLSAVGH